MVKVTIEIDELAGYAIEKQGETVKFDELSHRDKIRVCNALARGYELFIQGLREREQVTT